MMLGSLEYRYRWGWKIRGSQRTNRYANHRGQRIGPPIDCRTACRAKIDTHPVTAIANVDKFCGVTRNLNSINRIECPDAERTAGSSLAGNTMARDNQF
jgi:hypothetical protein